MKKVIFILTAMLLSVSLSGFAQPDLSQYTYFRVQNTSTGNYISVQDNTGYADITKKKFDAGAIGLISGFNNVVSDPGSIISLSMDRYGYFNLSTQGTSTKQIISNIKLTILNTDIENEYYLQAVVSPTKMYLVDKGSSLNYCVYGDRDKQNAHWNVIPVTDSEGQYFAIQPDIFANGKYYTTLYADFPFSVPTGMKALYVSSVADGIAELKEVESGQVPAQTPVIIECSFNMQSSCKLNLVDVNASSVSGNNLAGVFFNCSRSGHVNRTAFDASKMRVLQVSDGKLVFGKSSDAYIPANTAYLPVTSNTPDVVQLSYSAGINNVVMDEIIENSLLYDLQGRRVDNPGKGVYVKGGKKIVYQ